MAHAFLGILVVLLLLQLGAFARKKGELSKTHKLSLDWPLYLYIFTVLLSIMFIFAIIYYVISLSTLILINGTSGEEVVNYTFLQALYYSGVTLLSIGYGDFTPIGPARFLSIFEAFLGIVIPTVIFIKEITKDRT
jgi:potassium channel LctB